LVPERREEVTTEGGLDVAGQEEALRSTCQSMHEEGIEVSLFIDPDSAQIEAAARLGVGYVELHTGAFAEQYHQDQLAERELDDLARGAERAHELGLRVNAGHGLNLANIKVLFRVPHLVELNIGHSIVSRSILVGMEQAVSEMLDLIVSYPG
jgi:pyridoxine 5-phosphate synthase